MYGLSPRQFLQDMGRTYPNPAACAASSEKPPHVPPVTQVCKDGKFVNQGVACPHYRTVRCTGHGQTQPTIRAGEADLVENEILTLLVIMAKWVLVTSVLAERSHPLLTLFSKTRGTPNLGR
jgi:hypothetical protein